MRGEIYVEGGHRDEGKRERKKGRVRGEKGMAKRGRGEGGRRQFTVSSASNTKNMEM